MSFKEKTFSDRLQLANEAKKAALEKFRAKPAADDPGLLARQAERARANVEREKRQAERKVAREVEAAREAEAARLQAIEAAAAVARQAEEAAAKLVTDKAARDARYAARKKRK